MLAKRSEKVTLKFICESVLRAQVYVYSVVHLKRPRVCVNGADADVEKVVPCRSQAKFRLDKFKDVLI